MTAELRGKTCIIDRQAQTGQCGTVVLSARLMSVYCVCAFRLSNTGQWETDSVTLPCGWKKQISIRESIKGGPLEATTEAQIFQSACVGQARPGSVYIHSVPWVWMLPGLELVTPSEHIPENSPDPVSSRDPLQLDPGSVCLLQPASNHKQAQLVDSARSNDIMR